MYQLESCYDQEVPHMFPQVTYSYSISMAVRIPFWTWYFFHLFRSKVSTRSFQNEHKFYTGNERSKQSDTLTLDSQGNAVKLVIFSPLCISQNIPTVSHTIYYSRIVELFQDLCQMQDHWISEGKNPCFLRQTDCKLAIILLARTMKWCE